MSTAKTFYFLFALMLFSCQTDSSPMVAEGEDKVVPYHDFALEKPWEEAGAILEAEVDQQGDLRIRLEKGFLTFRPQGTNQLDVQFFPAYFPAPEQRAQGPGFKILSREKGEVKAQWLDQLLILGGEEGFLLWQEADSESEPLFLVPRGPQFSGQRIKWFLPASAEGYFGLGGAGEGLNLKSQEIHLWPSSDQSLFSPFFYEKAQQEVRSYFLNSGAQSYFNYEEENPWIGTLSGTFGLEIRRGSDLAKVRYPRVQKESQLIPLWMLGHHRVFQGDVPWEEFLARVQAYRDLRTPMDGVIFRAGTGFRENRLPTSAVQKLFQAISEGQSKPMVWLQEESWKDREAWVDPFGAPPHTELHPWLSREAMGFFWMDREPTPLIQDWERNFGGPIPFRHGVNWIGKERLLELFPNEEKTLGGFFRPVVTLEKGKSRNQALGEMLTLGLTHNTFPALWIKNQSGAKKETQLRDLGLGLFSPFFLTEEEMDQKGLWLQDRAFFQAFVSLIRQRYRLLPQFFQALIEAQEKGIPLMRPLFWDYGHDEETWKVDDQFMIGRDLLIAPLMGDEGDSRKVYLPRGEKWFLWPSGEELPGGYSELRTQGGAPLVLARGGAVILSAFPGEVAEETRRFQEEWHYFPAGRAELNRYWAFINGQEFSEAMNIQSQIQVELDPITIRFSHEPTQGTPPKMAGALVRFHRVRRPRRVLFNGRSIPIQGPSYGVTEADVVTSWYEPDSSLLVKVINPNDGFDLVLEFSP